MHQYDYFQLCIRIRYTELPIKLKYKTERTIKRIFNLIIVHIIKLCLNVSHIL